MTAQPLVAVVGNPNAGKSALFNALTGARQKLGSAGFGLLAQVRPGSEQLIQHGGFLRRGQGVQR